MSALWFEKVTQSAVQNIWGQVRAVTKAHVTEVIQPDPEAVSVDHRKGADAGGIEEEVSTGLSD